MRKLLINSLIVLSNIAVCYVVMFLSVFIHFFIYGSGALGARYSLRVAVILFSIHLAVVTGLFLKKIIINNAIVWGTCVLSIITLFMIHMYY